MLMVPPPETEPENVFVRGWLPVSTVPSVTALLTTIDGDQLPLVLSGWMFPLSTTSRLEPVAVVMVLAASAPPLMATTLLLLCELPPMLMVGTKTAPPLVMVSVLSAPPQPG